MRAVSDFRRNLRKTKKLELIFFREAEMKISISRDRTEFRFNEYSPPKKVILYLQGRDMYC